ncbi:hypothetical protein [Maribacter sp. 2308TA10-17]|uniref:hypothetical protein n=1 Tax=Maribacter sp. 2308TA10-17 TaxID=3386276 RepID=UPI0039BCCF01
MEISKIAIEWAKAEVFSSKFFIFFALLFFVGSIGFWQLGKTETARAYIWPTLVAGVLLMAVGVGILIANTSRITSFANDYESDATAFVKSEIVRTEKSMGEYKTIVFKVIPVIIIVAALLIVFMDKPLWRAICITTIAMMTVILLVDSNANTRILSYHEQLKLVDK